MADAAPDNAPARSGAGAELDDAKTITGPCHECKHELALRARYDTGRPMASAPFTATFQDGSQVSGTLDGNGEAIVKGCPPGAAKVERGEEPATYEPTQAPENPDYKRDIEPDRLRAELARVQDKLREKRAEGEPVMGRVSGETLKLRQRRDELIQKLDGTSDAGGNLSWLWGTLAGEFNEDPSAGQILVNTIITMVPVVDQVADLRDMLAITIRLTEPEERSKTANWVTLALTLIGLIPTVGSALKGVAKMAYQFGPQAAKADELLRVLRYFGVGDAMTWLSQQLGKWSDHTDTVVETFKGFCDGVIKALDGIPFVETQPTIDAVKAMKREAAGKLRSAMAEIKKPLQQFVEQYKVKKTGFSTPAGSKNHQAVGDPSTAPRLTASDATGVPRPGKRENGAPPTPQRSASQQQIDTAVSRANARGETAEQEALGEVGREMYMDGAGLSTDSRYVPRTHGPDDLARTGDGQLVGVEAKGNTDGNIALPRRSGGERQVSKDANLKNAKRMLTKRKQGKVGVPSRRKGGAYREDEMELYDSIFDMSGKKNLISTHTNTETGQVRVIERDGEGSPVGEEAFEIENLNDVKRQIRNKIGTTQ
jgi:hypothetical protein